MLILVEGPDCVGKTTLIENLRRYLVTHWGTDVHYRHAGPPRRHPLDEYELPLLGWHASDPYRTLICDRWHWGETVYPELLGRPTQLTDAAFLHIELALAARGAVVVYVTGAPGQIADCLSRRGDDLVWPSDAKRMVHLFDRVADRSILPTMFVNGFTDGDVSEEIVEFGAEAGIRAHVLNRFTTYVGPACPDVLLLGDVRGGDPATHGNLPAFLPYKGSCGEYLLGGVIDAADRKELAGVGLANANDVDDLSTLIGVTCRPVVIPLGRRAERALARQAEAVGLRMARDVPHPQYWKRFRHRERGGYGELIVSNWRKTWN